MSHTEGLTRWLPLKPWIGSVLEDVPWLKDTRDISQRESVASLSALLDSLFMDPLRMDATRQQVEAVLPARAFSGIF